MQDNQIIQKSVSILNDDLIHEFDVVIREPVMPIVSRRTFWDKLTKKTIPDISQPETVRHFEIYEGSVATVLRISGKAGTLPVDLFEEEEKMLAYAPEHLPTMIYIIAAAVQNTAKEPDPELIKFFTENLTNKAVARLMAAALLSTNMPDFLTSIVSVQWMASILKPKASPLDGSE